MHIKQQADVMVLALFVHGLSIVEMFLDRLHSRLYNPQLSPHERDHVFAIFHLVTPMRRPLVKALAVINVGKI